MGNSKLSDRITGLEANVKTLDKEITRLRDSSHKLFNAITKMELAEKRDDKFEEWIEDLKIAASKLNTKIAVHDVKLYAIVIVISSLISGAGGSVLDLILNLLKF